jgi:fibronectin type 3 domain-containing protein
MNEDGTGVTRLTNNSADDWYPCFSPDGTKIAFVSSRDGNNEIYIMNSDGTNQTRLTNNSADDRYPCFSPDGTKIAFQSNRDGYFGIYVMNIDGTGVTRLTNPSISIGDYHPSFSPDGTKIAFSSLRDGNAEIYIMNSDGTNQTRLTNNSANDGEPCFSPDGTKIAFVSDRDGRAEIYLMNLDGTGVTRLTNNSAFEEEPCFSPDGTKIAFSSDRDGNYEIYVMNSDGTSQIRLTNNSASDTAPSFSGVVSDTTPPSAITDLQATSPTSSSITLTWTAVGDDGNTGTATTYDIRYSTATITETNWSSAIQVKDVPAPKIAGEREKFVVTGLSPGTTYYFAIKVKDEAGNTSGLSNVVSAKTTTITADEQAIRDAFAGMEIALEAENLAKSMSYFSNSYLQNGYNKDYVQNMFQDAFNKYNSLDIVFTNIVINILGNEAVVDYHIKATGISTATGKLEVLGDQDAAESGDVSFIHWKKEGDNWLIFGNQKKGYCEVRTGHQKGNPDNYSLNFEVRSGLFSSGYVTGPNISGSLNLVSEDGGAYAWQNLGSTRPNIGDTYTFHLNYLDDTTEDITVKVTGIVDVFANILTPVNNSTILGNIPKFSWDAVSGIKGYRIEVYEDTPTYNRIWEAHNIPPEVTSLIYGGPALTEGGQYNWSLFVLDNNNNYSGVSSKFIVGTPTIEANVSTVHIQSPEEYQLNFDTFGDNIISVKVSGPQINKIFLDKKDINRFGKRIPVANRPNIGDKYNFEIEYNDSLAILSSSVSNIVDTFVSCTSPANNGTSATTLPVFTWNKLTIPAGNSISIYVSDLNNNFIWFKELPNDIDKVLYNDDNTAKLEKLIAGEKYYWGIINFDTSSHEGNVGVTKLLFTATTVDEDAIRNAYSQFSNLFAAEDPAYKNYFSLNYLHEGENYNYITSKIDSWFSEFDNLSLTFDIKKIVVLGDLAHVELFRYSSGTNTATGIVEFNSGFNIDYLKKENGVWKQYGDQKKAGAWVRTTKRASEYWIYLNVREIAPNATPIYPIQQVVVSGPGLSPVTITSGTYYEEDQGYMWNYCFSLGNTPPKIGDKYNFEITYKDATVEKIDREVQSVVEEFANPIYPVNVTINNNKPVFEWNPVEIAERYRIYVQDSNYKHIWQREVPKGQTKVQFNDDKTATAQLTTGNTYYWNIEAVDIFDNTSSLSAQFTVGEIDTTPPSTPTGVVVFAGNGLADINWNKNTETDLAGYNIYRSEDGVNYLKINKEIIPKEFGTFIDEGLTNGKTYYYKISAGDINFNVSALSDAVSVTPVEKWTGDTVLPLMLGYSAIMKDSDGVVRKLRINSKETIDGKECFVLDILDESDIVREKIYLHQSGNILYILKEIELDKTISYITPYKFLVYPLELGKKWQTSGLRKDSLGNISPYEEYSEITSTSAIVTTPAGTFNNCVKIKGKPEENYQEVWYFAPNVGIVRTENINLTTGNIVWYIELQSYTLPKPSSPKNLVATAKDKQIILSWSKNTEPNIAGYNIYRSDKMDATIGEKIATTTNTSYTDVNVVNNKIYYYTVTAYNTSGYESEPSNLVRIAPYTNKFTLKGNIWQMVSVPFVLENLLTTSIYPAESAIYIWDEELQYDPVYAKYKVPDKILLGLAYWIKLPSDTEITYKGGIFDINKEYIIPIKIGWNQIANPYVYNLNFAGAEINDGSNVLPIYEAVNSEKIGSSIYWYSTEDVNNIGYRGINCNNAILKVGEGYWLYSNIAGELIIKPVEETQIISGMTKAKEKYLWRYKISAKAGKYADTDNYIGVGEGVDFCSYEPPVLGEYVSLYFKKDGKKERLTDEIKDTSSELVWNMIVETNIKKEKVKITFEEIEKLSEGNVLLLEDLTSGKRVNITKEKVYEFTPGAGGIREFRIRVVKESEISKTLNLKLENISTYPNPYMGKLQTGVSSSKAKYQSPNVTFRYKADGIIQNVVIEIYNIKGKLIARFFGETDGDTEWDGVSNLSNGVYIYRITVSDGIKKVSKTGKLVILK